jgi:hypothetical protein
MCLFAGKAEKANHSEQRVQRLWLGLGIIHRAIRAASAPTRATLRAETARIT